MQRARGLCSEGYVLTFGRCESQQPHCLGPVGARSLDGPGTGCASPLQRRALGSRWAALGLCLEVTAFSGLLSCGSWVAGEGECDEGRGRGTNLAKEPAFVSSEREAAGS